MRKKHAILLAVALIVISGAVLLIYMMDRKEYSIVYFSTGEVYVGVLDTFPDLELTDSYILQVSQDPADPTKNNFQLSPVRDALWAPERLHLVEKNIIFYGPLHPESAIAKALTER